MSNPWDNITTVAAPAIPESRTIRGEEIFFPGLAGSAGIVVTENTAIQLPTLLSVLNVLASDTAVLPLNVYRRLPDGTKIPLADDPRDELLCLSPDGETTAIVWRAAWMFHALVYGSGYAEIQRKGRGMPYALHLLDPRSTRACRDADGDLRYDVDGGRKKIPAGDVLHLSGLSFDGVCGLNFVRLLREAIGVGLATQGYTADFFGNGSDPGGIIEVPYELKGDAAKNLRESWELKHKGYGKRHGVAVLEQGAKFAATSVDPEKSQLVESRKFQGLEVARPYRVPPHKAGDFSQAHLANIEASNTDYLTTALMWWLVGIEQQCRLKLFSKSERASGLYVEHNVAALLRGDTTSRFNAYSRALADGWMSRDEVRARENMSPIGEEGGGDKHLVQMNQTTLDRIGEDETTEPPAEAAMEEATGEEVNLEDQGEPADEPTGNGQLAGASSNGNGKAGSYD